MRVRKGTYEDGRPARWVETSLVLQLSLSDLIDGLCSHYWRNWCEGDVEPPNALAERTIMQVVRQEFSRYGANAVWTWCEESNRDTDEAREWARRAILAVFPDFGTEES